MTHNANCPPQCRTRLGHLEQSIAKLETKHDKEVDDIYSKVNNNYQHWEVAVNDRVKTSTFRWGVGIGVTILALLLGGIYAQITATDRNIVKLKVEAAKVSTLLENHMEDTEDQNQRVGE